MNYGKKKPESQYTSELQATAHEYIDSLGLVIGYEVTGLQPGKNYGLYLVANNEAQAEYTFLNGILDYEVLGGRYKIDNLALSSYTVAEHLGIVPGDFSLLSFAQIDIVVLSKDANGSITQKSNIVTLNYPEIQKRESLTLAFDSMQPADENNEQVLIRLWARQKPGFSKLIVSWSHPAWASYDTNDSGEEEITDMGGSPQLIALSFPLSHKFFRNRVYSFTCKSFFEDSLQYQASFAVNLEI